MGTDAGQVTRRASIGTGSPGSTIIYQIKLIRSDAVGARLTTSRVGESVKVASSGNFARGEAGGLEAFVV